MAKHEIVDLSSVTGFQWDKGNERKSQVKQGVSQAEAEEVFFNIPLLLQEDARHSQLEPRFHALGRTDAGRQFHITFTIRGRMIRVISARDMHRKERRIYEDHSKIQD